MAYRVVYHVMFDDELQDVEELLHGVAFIDDDLLCPVGEHLVAFFEFQGDGWCEDFECLTHDIACFQAVGF